MESHSPPRKLPITVVMVVYRGEDTIERALRSVADLADEIIVSHNGPPVDRAVEIARRYTDTVFVQPEFLPTPEPYRAFVYGKATHEWIFQLDADEFLSEELRDALPGLIADPLADGYAFRWPTWHRGRFRLLGFHRMSLFRKQKFSFLGAPDENLRPSTPDVRVRTVPYPLMHQPQYDNFTWVAFRRKWIPWAKIHAAYFFRDLQRVPAFNLDTPGWDWRTTVRLRYPLLLGVLGSFCVHLGFGVRYFFRSGSPLALQLGFQMALYNALVYVFYLRFQRRGVPPEVWQAPLPVPRDRVVSEQVPVAVRA